jgi:hypothetical protein
VRIVACGTYCDRAAVPHMLADVEAAAKSMGEVAAVPVGHPC